MQLKENDKLVHIFKYGNKEIPLYYNFENIQDRLKETTKIIELFLKYVSEKGIVFSEEEKNLIMAEEDICSSYIEGYETYLSPKFVVEGYSSGSLEDRATLSGYDAYRYAFKEYFDKGIIVDDASKIVDIWKKLVKYKRFFRKNIRVIGVRVGNALHTVHVAPAAKYVKPLLNDMFESLKKYENEKEDSYKLLDGILFHYIFTFIHPFLDGNGRSARLIEQLMLLKNSGISCCVPFSSIILRNKRNYYKSFNSGQTFGDSHLDVLTIDITDFINYNLYVIEQGIIKLCDFMNISFEYTDVPKFDLSDMESFFNYLGQFDRVKFKEYINNLEIYCNLLLNKTIEMHEDEMDYLYVNFKDNTDFLKMIEKKWEIEKKRREEI